MSIIRHEFKKILTTPSIIGFVLVCLVFNTLLVFSGRNNFANYIAEVSSETGFRLGAEFDERLSALSQDDNAAWLRLQTEGMTDIYDGFDTAFIAETYIEVFELSGTPARLMRLKYEQLQTVVEANRESGVGLDLYYAGHTYDRHTQLYRVIMTALLFEGIILTSLIMLLSLGNEHSAKTEFVVYATKTGRRVNRAKLISSTASGLAGYILLATVTLTAYFAVNPLGGTAGSNVSSGFNYIIDNIVGSRPFLTWFSFTVPEYTLAVACASLGIILCFGLMAYITGLWFRNGYIGFLALALINFAVFSLPFIIFGLSLPSFFIMMTPIWLAVALGSWFTEGGSNILLPHFEIIGTLASLGILAALSLWSSAMFKRRNLL